MRIFITLLLLSVTAHAIPPTAYMSEGRNRTRGNIAFTLTEPLGIAHREQLVELDMQTPSEPFYVIDSGGTYYPHQIAADGKLLLLLESGMTADQVIELEMIPGETALDDYANPITRTDEATRHLLETSSTAIRIPKADASPTFLQPLQAFKYQDGTWAMTGDKLVKLTNSEVDPTSTDNRDVTWVEEGPLRWTVDVDTQFTRQGSSDRYYNARIQLFSHDPEVVLMESHSNDDVYWEIVLDTGLVPDRGQYIPHTTDNTNWGYHPVDLTTFSNGSTANPVEAYVDLPFTINNDYDGRRLFRPWPAPGTPTNTGRTYWMFSDTAGAAGSNMLALFNGPVSRIIGCHYSGWEPHSEGGNTQTKLRHMIWRTGPDATYGAINRWSYGFYIGLKSEIGAYNVAQDIQKKQTLYAGMNLSKVLNLNLELTDPTVGHAYLSDAGFQSWVDDMQASANNSSGAWGDAHSTASSYDYIWQAVNDPATYATTAVNTVTAQLTSVFNRIHNYYGIYDENNTYWKLVRNISTHFFAITTLLALDEYQGSSITDAQRQDLLDAASIFTNLLQDNDHVPLQDEYTSSLGTSNMPVQYKAGRDRFALYTSLIDGAQTIDLTEIKTVLDASIESTVNAYGVHESAPHYMGEASFQPLAYLMLQLQRAGELPTINSKVALMADYLMAMHTPTEARYGTATAVVSLGDGPTERIALTGTLATLFKTADPTLAGELIKTWRDNGSYHENILGPTVVINDTSIASGTRTTGDKFWNGFGTVLRNHLDDPLESVMHFVHGTYYRDHRHHDQGSFSLYAMGAPISIDWGPQYDPRVAGNYFHNVVVPSSKITTWTNAYSGMDADIFGDEDGQDTILSSTSNFGVNTSWAETQIQYTDGADTDTQTRRITRYNEIEDSTVIYRVEDDWGGDWIADSKIASYNFMASGAVVTPDGNNTPPAGTLNTSTGTATEYSLAAGIHKFEFTGQWVADFTVFVIADAATDYIIQHFEHNVGTSAMKTLWVAENGGTYSEEQYIFRLKSTGTFDIVIVPYVKASPPTTLTLTESGGVYTLNYDGTNITL